MRLNRVQRVVGVIGLLLLLGLVICPKWQLHTRWVPMDVGGGQMEPVASIVITWHQWLWNRPPDAAGIAWLYMANEAGMILGGTVALMLLFARWPKSSSLRSSQ